MLRINNWIRRIELPLCYFAVGPINTKHCGYLGIFYSSSDETTSMHRWSIGLPLIRRFLWREPSPSFQFDLVKRIVSIDRNTNGPRFDSFCESSFALITQRCRFYDFYDWFHCPAQSEATGKFWWPVLAAKIPRTSHTGFELEKGSKGTSAIVRCIIRDI